MRTTLRIDAQLLAEAKAYAAQTGRTFTALVEDAIREVLLRRRGEPPVKRVRLKTHGRGGLRPGVDLDDAALLTDLMDLGDAAP